MFSGANKNPPDLPGTKRPEIMSDRDGQIQTLLNKWLLALKVPAIGPGMGAKSFLWALLAVINEPQYVFAAFEVSLLTLSGM